MLSFTRYSFLGTPQQVDHGIFRLRERKERRLHDFNKYAQA